MTQNMAYIEQAQVAPLPNGFVYLDEASSGILWDAKYATEDNFTGSVVDGYEANRIVCSEEMLTALLRARDIALEEGYLLLVWDCARPQRAVDRFVEWAAEPEDNRTKEAHYPHLKKTSLFSNGYIAKKSGHSRGCAVDLTLADAETGEEVDMGGIFDLMDKKSHHGAGGISEEATRNRGILLTIMQQAGFKSYSDEWWHYSLKKEPYPDTYFDFIITPPAEEEFIAPAPAVWEDE